MAESSRQDLVAFNNVDASGLLAMLAMAGGDRVSQRNEGTFAILFGKTKTGGIAANGSANVYLREPTTTGWADTTKEVAGWNESSVAIAAGKKVILIPINGRWAAFEVC